MKLECYVLSSGDIDIRPASNRRDWMDATPDRYAYRCLPLSIANAHGWVICCGGGFSVEWNGGNEPRDVSVSLAGDGEVKVEGHFGSGIVTISIPAMFRTEADYNLYVSGPPNSFKDGIHPLSAIVETDWMPYSFTMNWKITRPNHSIAFEKGEPFCFLFPVKRGLVEQVEPVLRDLDEDAESKRQFKYAGRLRKFLADVKQIRKDVTPDPKAERALRFQRWYMQGTLPDGSGVFEDHQKSLEIKPFADLRNRATRARP